MSCIQTAQIVQIQDFSASFGPFVSDMISNVDSFLVGLRKEIPDVKYGFTSFIDKPLPFLGWGWGDFNSDDYLIDYCYHLHNGLSEQVILEDIDVATFTGGNDALENQIGAVINAVLDPSIGWSESAKDEQGNDIVKIALLVTSSTSHGANLAGLINPRTQKKWPSIPNVTRGWDMWWTATYWKSSYGLDHLAGYPNNPMESWIWPTEAQFSYHNHCGYGTEALEDYVILGEKVANNVTLTNNEKSRWLDVIYYCDPIDFYEYIGVPPEDLENHPHEGGFQSEDECLYQEYPNQDQLKAALDQSGTNIIVIIPEDNQTEGLPYYKWSYGCSKSNHGECVKQFYEDLFATAGINGTVVQCSGTCDIGTAFLDAVMKAIGGIAPKYCDTTTPVPTTGTTEDISSSTVTTSGDISESSDASTTTHLSSTEPSAPEGSTTEASIPEVTSESGFTSSEVSTQSISSTSSDYSESETTSTGESTQSETTSETSSTTSLFTENPECECKCSLTNLCPCCLPDIDIYIDIDGYYGKYPLDIDIDIEMSDEDLSKYKLIKNIEMSEEDLGISTQIN